MRTSPSTFNASLMEMSGSDVAAAAAAAATAIPAIIVPIAADGLTLSCCSPPSTPSLPPTLPSPSPPLPPSLRAPPPLLLPVAAPRNDECPPIRDPPAPPPPPRVPPARGGALVPIFEAPPLFPRRGALDPILPRNSFEIWTEIRNLGSSLLMPPVLRNVFR